MIRELTLRLGDGPFVDVLNRILDKGIEVEHPYLHHGGPDAEDHTLQSHPHQQIRELINGLAVSPMPTEVDVVILGFQELGFEEPDPNDDGAECPQYEDMVAAGLRAGYKLLTDEAALRLVEALELQRGEFVEIPTVEKLGTPGTMWHFGHYTGECEHPGCHPQRRLTIANAENIIAAEAYMHYAFVKPRTFN